MIDLTETLIDKGHAYVVDNGSVYYDVASFEGYGKLSGNTLENLREGHRDLETDPRKRNPADFALWKAAGPGRLMKLAEPMGRRVPRLAHRVLGDVDEVPRRALRHPHGRHRPSVPAPRGRDRAVRGRRRASGRVDLGARRPPASVRAEDREVDRQRDLRARPDRARVRPAGVPLAVLPDAVPLGDGLHLGRDGDRRPAGQAAAAAHGRVGAGVDRARRRRQGVRRARSARRSRTTSTCPGVVAIVNELDRAARTCRRREVRRCSRRGTTCSASISNATRRAGWEPTARDAAR